MFGVKKINIDSSLKIWVKKLNVLDFTGCDYVPLVFSYVEPKETHKRRNDENKADTDVLKKIFEKAIVRVKTAPKMSIDEFIDGALKNKNITEMIYTYIYTETFKKKIVKQML